MSTYEVTTDDGVYEVEVDDGPAAAPAAIGGQSPSLLDSLTNFGANVAETAIPFGMADLIPGVKEAAAKGRADVMGGYKMPSSISEGLGNFSRNMTDPAFVRSEIAGPALNTLNSMTFNLGDEISAGGASILDALNGSPLIDSYNQRLGEARGAVSDFRDSSPGMALMLDLAGASKMPVPDILSKEKGIVEAAKNIGKSGALGAGIGGAYGFGGGEGTEDRAGGALMNALFGAGLGSGLQLIGEGLSGGINLIKGLAPRAQAAKELAPFADEISTVAQKPNDQFFPTRTLAEETQNPELATLQQALTDRYVPANKELVANEAARRDLQDRILQSLSTQPEKNAEVAGTELRSLVKGEADKAFEQAIAAGVPLDSQQLTIPVGGLRDKLMRTVSQEYQAGGAPSELVSIADELAGRQNGPARMFFQNGKLKSEIGASPTETFQYLHDLRERASGAWSQMKGVDDKGSRVARLMIDHIDDAIKAAPENGGTFTRADADKFATAKQMYSDAMTTFGEGKIGGSLQGMKTGQYFTKGSDVVEKYFDGTPEGTKQLLKALPDVSRGAKPQEVEGALTIARGAVRDMVKRETVSNDGILKPEAFRTWIRNNKEALTAKIDGKALFEPEHISNLEQIANDLAFLSPQSQQSVKGLALRASKGQPTTAQRLILDAKDIGIGSLNKLPLVGNTMQKYQEKIDAILSEALIRDKGLAKTLVQPATPKSLDLASKALAPVLNLTQRAEGSQQSDRYSPRSSASFSGADRSDPISQIDPRVESQVDPRPEQFEAQYPSSEVAESKGVSKKEDRQLSNPSLPRKSQYRESPSTESGNQASLSRTFGSTVDGAIDRAERKLSDAQIDELGRSGSQQTQAALEMGVRRYMQSGMSESEAKAHVRDDVRTGKLDIGTAMDKAQTKLNGQTDEKIRQVEARIDQDPYYSALYEAESGRDPYAKNPETSASGAFQFVKKTAKSLGLADPFDIEASFEKVQQLTDAHAKRFGDDPAALYSAHYLGATVFNKLRKGEKLTRDEQRQVEYLENKALPDFLKIYKRVKSKQVEA